MPAKKSPKKVADKKQISKTPRKEEVNSVSRHGFLGVLIVFAGFSLYAIASFFNSTSDLLNQSYTSVIDETGEVIEVPAEEKYFEDVYAGHPNVEAIMALYHDGIVKGYDDGTFGPGDLMNRAEFLTVVANAVSADLSSLNNPDYCFTDVSDQWFSAFACYGKENYWVNGYEDGSFGPGNYVTKAEAIKIIFEATGYMGQFGSVCDGVEGAVFNDAQPEDWYYAYACVAKSTGVISATDRFFNPSYQVTRADISQMLYNVLVNLGMM